MVVPPPRSAPDRSCPVPRAGSPLPACRADRPAAYGRSPMLIGPRRMEDRHENSPDRRRAAALAAPAARAQQADEPAAAVSGQAEPGSFLVYFGFDKATLDASARQVVAEAADEYKRTGAAQVAVTGHADKAVRPPATQRLSERRAEGVRRGLERLGVPSSAVQVAAEGENDPAVPTADGVPEARNRRGVIAVPQPAPSPPAVAPETPPPPVVAEPAHAPPPERPKRFVFSLGPIYGHNFREQDRG